MTEGLHVTEDMKFKLLHLIKKCGFQKRHISLFLGESRQMVFHDFSGCAVSAYRMKCYKHLIPFLDDLYQADLAFKKYPYELGRLAAARRNSYAASLSKQFTTYLNAKESANVAKTAE
jgi:hypothetical protein